MGGATLAAAIQQLTTSVPAWAAVLGCAFAVWGASVPPTVALVAVPLAHAHLQLALVVTGVGFKAAVPSRLVRPPCLQYRTTYLIYLVLPSVFLVS